VNKQWHEENRLAPGASFDERVRWHLEHAKACGCRPVPPKVLEEIERRELGSEMGH